MQTATNTQEQEIDSCDLSEWETIDGLVSKHPDKFTKSQIQWKLRFREENGLDVAVRKFGRQIYIHVPSFIRIAFCQRGAA